LMGLMIVMHSSYVILSFLYFFVCEHEKCGRTSYMGPLQQPSSFLSGYYLK
jgi:hypothetical protein